MVPASCSTGLLGSTCVASQEMAFCFASCRYCAQRQQFGPPDAQEVAVLDYQVTILDMLYFK